MNRIEGIKPHPSADGLDPRIGIDPRVEVPAFAGRFNLDPADPEVSGAGLVR